MAILSGLVAGVLIGKATEYYTSDTYKPTQELSSKQPDRLRHHHHRRSGSGHAVHGGAHHHRGGVHPAGVLPVPAAQPARAWVCTASRWRRWACCPRWASPWPPTPTAPWPTTPAASRRWPVWTPEVRKRTDALDSLGNTTAATGKGFAIGSAALTALALMASYIEKVQGGRRGRDVRGLLPDESRRCWWVCSSARACPSCSRR